MMDRKFELILENCLAKLDRGRSLQEVLACYPDLEEKLQPLLLAAMLSRALPQPVPSQTAIRLGKNQLLARMDAIQAAGGFRKPTQPQPLPKRLLDQWSRNLRQVLPGNSGYQPAYRLAAVAVIVLFAGGFFTLNASASRNPGNFLYQLKMGLERARVVWSFNTNQKRTSEETAPELRSVTDSAEMINLAIKYNDYPGNKGKSIWDIGSSSGKGDQESSYSVSLGSVQVQVPPSAEEITAVVEDRQDEIEIKDILEDGEEGTLIEEEKDEEKDKVKEEKDKVKVEKDKVKVEKDKVKVEKDKDKKDKDK